MAPNRTKGPKDSPIINGMLYGPHLRGRHCARGPIPPRGLGLMLWQNMIRRSNLATRGYLWYLFKSFLCCIT